MTRTLWLLGVLGLTLLGSHASARETIVKSFDGVERIRFSTGSGDAEVRRGSGSGVEVTVTHNFDKEAFRPVFRQSGADLVIREQIDGRSFMGSASWQLEIPDGIEVRISTGSGTLSVEDLTVELDASAGSGDIDVRNITGDVRVSEGSGDVTLVDVRGKVRVSEGSGDIDVRNLIGDFRATTGSGWIRVRGAEGDVSISAGSNDIELVKVTGAMSVTGGSSDITGSDLTISGDSSFSTGSGDAEIGLAAPLDYDTRIRSGSGDAVLDFGGHEISGRVEMRALERSGRIVAPFPFDEEYEEGAGRSTVMVKQALLGDGAAGIQIGTGSGTARIRN